MTAYATVSDVETRWRVLDAAEQATAEALLDDAAAIIRSQCPGIDDKIAAGTLDPGIPLIVSVGMVKRAMASMATGYEGVSGLQQTAGPFVQNTTFTNPTGNLYLTKSDRKLLGYPMSRAYAVEMAPDAVWPCPGRGPGFLWTDTYTENLGGG